MDDVDDPFDRVTRYEAAASATFVPLRLIPVDPPSFDGTMRAVRIGDLVVAKISAQPGAVLREPARMTSTDRELVKIALHGYGRAGVAQDDRQTLVRPGDLVAYETTRPYELPSWERYGTVVVGVPRHMFGAHARQFRRCSATPVAADGGVRALAASFFRDVADSADVGETDAGSSPAAQHLADALVSMVMAVFADVAPERVDLATPLLERVLAYCGANLADPNLSVESVAAAHHISVRYLQKLCRSAGFTLSAWVRQQRLERICRELTDPALAQHSIAAIAARWGILDASHLGRALKAQYGRTAADIRSGGRAETPGLPGCTLRT